MQDYSYNAKVSYFLVTACPNKRNKTIRDVLYYYTSLWSIVFVKQDGTKCIIPHVIILP